MIFIFILLFLSIVIFKDFYNEIGEAIIYLSSNIIRFFKKILFKEKKDSFNNVILLDDYRKSENLEEYKKVFTKR